MANSSAPEHVDPQEGVRPCGLFVVDLDGTLLRSDRTVASHDLDALRRLGEHGVVRTIATGRSLFSFNTVEIPDLSIDFVVFSTGAGVLEFNTGNIIRKTCLKSREVERIGAFLQTCNLDFMIHQPIPDNHRFAYYRANSNNQDFDRRLELYNRHAESLSNLPNQFGRATQLLAVVPAGKARATLATIRRELGDFNVIQTTSPLDGESTWIEIFPPSVSKSQTTAWLADKLRIRKQHIVAVGNDYNDLDLLEWSANSYVVANAPEDLKRRFTNVSSNNDGGVAEAATKWIAEMTIDD